MHHADVINVKTRIFTKSVADDERLPAGPVGIVAWSGRDTPHLVVPHHERGCQRASRGVRPRHDEEEKRGSCHLHRSLRVYVCSTGRPSLSVLVSDAENLSIWAEIYRALREENEPSGDRCSEDEPTPGRFVFRLLPREQW